MTDNEILNLILDKVTTLEADMQDVKHKVTTLEADMQDVKYKVTKIDLTIDNEIRVNIKRVAEGHLDLSRNLKEAKISSSEVEMLAIKVNMLDTNVRELNHKIS